MATATASTAPGRAPAAGSSGAHADPRSHGNNDDDDDDDEQQLVALHERLWGLMAELLVPPEEEVGGAGKAPGSRKDGRRPPSVVVEEVKLCKEEIDAVWTRRQEAATQRGEAGGKALEARRKQLEGELRERYLAYTTEAFADELDALRRDPTFRGTEEDIRAMVGMLGEGAEALLAEDDEETLGIYRDYLGDGPAAADGDNDDDANVLSEPVHAWLRRQRGMPVAKPGGGSSSGDDEDEDEDEDEDGMEESSDSSSRSV